MTDRFGPASGESAYRTLTGLLTWWLDRTIRLTAMRSTAENEVLPGEGALQQRFAAAGIVPWIDARDAIMEQIARADSVNLDRKQVALNAFFGLAGAARQTS